MGYTGVDFWLALSFLTAVPTPKFNYDKSSLGRSGVWFPLIGLLIGFILLGFQIILTNFLPRWPTAVLLTFIWVMLTGGLHIDGLADCFDGFLAPVTRERRFEIMKDPRLGAFGAIGLVLTLMLKVSLLADLRPYSFGILLAPVVARWMILWVTRWPFVNESGMGASFAKDVTNWTIGIAGVVPIWLTVWLGWQAVMAFGAAIWVTIICLVWAKRAIGGFTGDVIGFVVEWSETAVLLVMVLRI